jgi:hypothetical protein
MDAISDRVSVRFFDEEDEEEDVDPVPDREQLVHRQKSLWSRASPDSFLGGVLYVVAGLLLSAILLWLRPAIPPWFTSLPALLTLLIVVALAVGLVTGRRSGIRFWGQFTDFKLYTGSSVVEFVGKVDGSAGDDPLIKAVTDVSPLGFGVDYERVDDRFKATEPLLSKIDRKTKSGEWEPARGKLDNVYMAEGPSAVFDDAVVVHCSGLSETPTAKAFEWKTDPPELVDVDAVRELQRRDKILREQVIPHYQEMQETQDDQVERFKRAAQDDEPHIKLSDLPELMLAFGAVTGQGSGQQRSTQDAIEAVDRDVEEAMEGRTDE